MLDFVDELALTNNAYRTKKYIVTQRIIFRQNEVDGSMVISIEVFYERTKDRDAIYEKVFKKRINVEGKRLHCTMFTRSYVQ